MVLFEGIRTMGEVTSSDVKFKLSSLGAENFVLTAVERSWQVFKCERLTVSFTGVRDLSHIHVFLCIYMCMSVNRICVGGISRVFGEIGYFQRKQIESNSTKNVRKTSREKYTIYICTHTHTHTHTHLLTGSNQ